MILSILKIIGIVLLCIIALVLILAAIVLFVPVRYYGDADYHDEFKGQFKVTWLLRIVCFIFSYDGEADMSLRLFGKELDVDKKKEVSGKSEKDVPAPAPKEKEEKAEAESADKDEPESSMEEPKVEEDKSEELNRAERRFSLRRLLHDGRSIREKVKSFFKKAKDKSVSAVKTLTPILSKEENYELLGRMLSRLKKIIKHVLPKKLSGKAVFGSEDPATTGKMLTWITPFYPMYGDSFEITPLFDENRLEGDAHFYGRFNAFPILWHALMIWLDKDFKRVYNQIRK